jgi:hypothetical protein
MAAADQPRVRDGMVRSAARAGGDQDGAAAGAAGHTADAHGLEGFRQDHRRQNGGEAPRQHRLARPRRAEEQDIMVTTPG